MKRAVSKMLLVLFVAYLFSVSFAVVPAMGAKSFLTFTVTVTGFEVAPFVEYGFQSFFWDGVVAGDIVGTAFGVTAINATTGNLVSMVSVSTNDGGMEISWCGFGTVNIETDSGSERGIAVVEKIIGDETTFSLTKMKGQIIDVDGLTGLPLAEVVRIGPF